MKNRGSLGLTWHQEEVAYHAQESHRCLMRKGDMEDYSIKTPHIAQIKRGCGEQVAFILILAYQRGCKLKSQIRLVMDF